LDDLKKMQETFINSLKAANNRFGNRLADRITSSYNSISAIVPT
jgi:hypothetical protein